MRRDDEVLARERDGQRALVGYLSARDDAGRVQQLLAHVAATGALEPALVEVLRARRGSGLDDAALQRAVAASRAAWARLDTPW
jgi:glutathione S-transferase